MPTQFLFRILAIGLTAASLKFLPDYKTWFIFYMSFGMAHYALSIIYSKGQIIELSKTRKGLFSIGVILLLIGGVSFFNVSFHLFFGIHHIFNEVYLKGKGLPLGHTTKEKFFRVNSLFVHGFAYASVLSHAKAFSFLPKEYFYFGFLVSYLVFIYAFFGVRSFIPKKHFLDNCLFEFSLPIIVIFSIYTKISFVSIVFYHITFWCFLPIPSLLEKGGRKVLSYVALNTVLTLFFLALSPLGFFLSYSSISLFISQFFFWGYVHVSSSFLLSRSHPVWITRLFSPA